MSGSSVAFLILHVDDILSIGNDIEFSDSIKGYLNTNFSVKYLGEAAYIVTSQNSKFWNVILNK